MCGVRVGEGFSRRKFVCYEVTQNPGASCQEVLGNIFARISEARTAFFFPATIESYGIQPLLSRRLHRLGKFHTWKSEIGRFLCSQFYGNPTFQRTLSEIARSPKFPPLSLSACLSNDMAARLLPEPTSERFHRAAEVGTKS